MFAELVAPEASIVLQPCYPVRIHPRKQIKAAKGLQKGANIWSRVRCNKCAVWQSIGSVRGWYGIILSIQVAVLGITTIAEVWPTNRSINVHGINGLAIECHTIGREVSRYQ